MIPGHDVKSFSLKLLIRLPHVCRICDAMPQQIKTSLAPARYPKGLWVWKPLKVCPK